MYAENALSQARAANKLFSGEQPAVASLEGLFSNQPVEKIEAGAAIFWEGDAADHVFAVVEGVLRIHKLLPDGRRVITGFIYPGDLVGISLRDRYLYTAEAVTPTRFRRFGRNRFQEEINKSPELRPQLFARLCDEMAAAQDQMVLLARKSAEERVASFLLIIANRLAGDQRSPVIDVPMTRLDMADYLGLTIETVSRTMTKLASRGVIAPCGRHAVTIHKLEMLALLAGESDEDDNRWTSNTYTQQAVWPH